LTSNNESSWSTPAEFFRQHIVWVLGLLPVFLAGLKILVLSEGDGQLLRFLLKDLNVVALMLATLMPVLPLAAFWALVAWVVWLRSPTRESGRTIIAEWIDFPAFLILLILLLFIPAVTLIMSVGLLIFMIVMQMFVHWVATGLPKHNPTRIAVSKQLLFVWLYSMLIIFIAATALMPVLWMPMELLKTHGSNPEPGYVLSMDKDWTTFLDRGNTVHIVKTADIESRSACFVGDWTQKPIVQLYSHHRSRNPPCPS
jgi:uncharacterized membrane protein YphA (DoxX/SURF4 family)